MKELCSMCCCSDFYHPVLEFDSASDRLNIRINLQKDRLARGPFLLPLN